ncbi:MAG: TonB-dependent receptor domain-containing protein, partial [Moraxellaceae bacterium]
DAQVELQNTLIKGKTDFEGKLTFNNIAAGLYTLNILSSEYAEKTIPGVTIKAGEIAKLTIQLQAEDTSINIVIYKKRNLADLTGATIIQRENNAVVEVVTSEMISRTTASKTSDVIKLSSGASIQDNKFAIIRGLNDRYNAAYLNGSPLPSSESDRKAFSFDMFPSNMLENLVISKSATADLPAEFAGGIIAINTKSIPEKNFFSFSLGTGFNSITTFKDQTTYEGGKLDWLGLDNGARSIPTAIPAYGSFPNSISEQANLAKQFSTSWGLNNQKFAPNYSLQFSSGMNKKIGEVKEFGFITAFTYSRTFNYNQTIRRGYTNGTNPNAPQASQIDYDYLDKNNVESVLSGALANFSFKLNDKNTFSFQNIYSINSDDKLINRTGEINPLEANPSLLRSNARWFTSNAVYSGQITGKHTFKSEKTKLNWLAGYSNVQRSIPSLNRSIYTRNKYITDPNDPNPADTQYVANMSYSSVGPSYGGGMFFSKNKENSINLKADFSYDIIAKDSIKLQLKTGLYTQIRNRDFEARQLGYTKYGVFGGDVTFDESLLYLPEDQIYAPQNMGLIAPGVGGFKLTDGTKFSDAYQAQSTLNAAFAQLDQKYKKLHFVYGVRLEDFTQQLQARKDDNSKLEIKTHKLDLLPSFNGIYALNKSKNIRLSYSQTINRPEYRELAPFAFYDFSTTYVVSGNSNLQRAKIQNVDLRYESYPGKGQLFSASLFYKHFQNPIEQVTRPDVTGEISFNNVPTAKNFGLEVEARTLIGSLIDLDTTAFLSNVSIYGNIAVIRSKVDVSQVVGSQYDSRPLQGQSPYVLNAGIQYKHPKDNWGLALNLNKVGERIAIVGNVNEPDLWENSRTFLDLQITKSFWKQKGEFKLNIQNILAQDQVFYQNGSQTETQKGLVAGTNSLFIGDKNNPNGFQSAVDDQVWKTNFGRVFSFSIAVKL